jgi:hypothetical protein
MADVEKEGDFVFGLILTYGSLTQATLFGHRLGIFIPRKVNYDKLGKGIEPETK